MSKPRTMKTNPKKQMSKLKPRTMSKNKMSKTNSTMIGKPRTMKTNPKKQMSKVKPRTMSKNKMSKTNSTMIGKPRTMKTNPKKQMSKVKPRTMSKNKMSKANSTMIGKARSNEMKQNKGAFVVNNLAQHPVYQKMKLGESKYFSGTELSGYKETNYKLAYAGQGYKVTKNITGPKFEWVCANVGLLNLNGWNDNLNVNIGQADVSGHVSATHVGYDAKLTAVETTTGPLRTRLGVGLSSSVGMEDDSISVKVAGTGLKVGRKIGVSFFDSEIECDLHKPM
eukprot:628036_1